MYSISTSITIVSAETKIENVSAYSDTQLLMQLKEGKYINNNKIRIYKMNSIQKNNFLGDSDNIDLERSEVYVIDETLGASNGEVRAIADVVLEENVIEGTGISHMGESLDTGSASHVVITSIVGYTQITRNGASYRIGTYYGGYLNEKPSNAIPKSAVATYRDVGGYIDAQGNQGTQSSPYVKSTNYSVSNIAAHKMGRSLASLICVWGISSSNESFKDQGKYPFNK